MDKGKKSHLEDMNIWEGMGKRHSGYRTTEIMDSRAQKEQIQEGTEREVVFHFPHLRNPHPRHLPRQSQHLSCVCLQWPGEKELTLLNAPESQPGWGLKAAHWFGDTNLTGEFRRVISLKCNEIHKHCCVIEQCRDQRTMKERPILVSVPQPNYRVTPGKSVKHSEPYFSYLKGEK